MIAGVIFVLSLVSLCVADLQAIETAISNLYAPVQDVKMKYALLPVVDSPYNPQIAANLEIISKYISDLNANDFATMLTYTDPEQGNDGDFEIFELIMKILYYQFPTDADPRIRMYAFDILGKILSKFSSLQDRSDYLLTHLDAENSELWDAEFIPEGADEDPIDPNRISGPFDNPFSVFESQLYNYYINYINANNPVARGGYTPAATSILHNMYVVLDYIMECDYKFGDPDATWPNEDDPTTFIPAYIYHFEINRVADLLSSFADIDQNPDTLTYVRYLIFTYFIQADADDNAPTQADVIGYRTTYTYSSSNINKKRKVVDPCADGSNKCRATK